MLATPNVALVGYRLSHRHFDGVLRAHPADLVHLARAGVQLIVGRTVTGLVLEGGTVRGVRLRDETVACHFVVNAGGSRAGQVDPRMSLPVVPMKGQMLSLRSLQPSCGGGSRLSIERMAFSTSRRPLRTVNVKWPG